MKKIIVFLQKLIVTVVGVVLLMALFTTLFPGKACAMGEGPGTSCWKATVTPSPTIQATVTSTIEPTIQATVTSTIEPTIQATVTSTIEPTIQATATNPHLKCEDLITKGHLNEKAFNGYSHSYTKFAQSLMDAGKLVQVNGIWMCQNIKNPAVPHTGADSINWFDIVIAWLGL